MLDHDLPAWTFAAAVDAAYERAQMQSTQRKAKDTTQPGDPDEQHKETSQ